MGMGINFLVIDDDMMAMLPETLDSRISWEAVQDEFGSTEVIFIAFGNKDKTIYNTEAFSLIWDLTVALENLDQVEKVSCITTLSRIDSEDGFMEISDLQPERDLNLTQIDKPARIRALPVGQRKNAAAAYSKDIRATTETTRKLVTALKTGNLKAAAALIKVLKQQRRAGHDKYQEEDEE
tara:strand:+ start:102 stop:644 length:543 start_codon:yes stop_codon:yes gene_type:complete